MLICLLGIIIIIFGVFNLFLINNSNEDKLPIPKERIYRLLLLIILIGLLFYEIGRFNINIIKYYTSPIIQNNNKI